MMAATTLSVEETNHLRAVYLCYRVAPEAVRTYFDKQHPPAILVSNLTTQKPILQKIKGKILKQYQWDQLYPPTGTPIQASTDFDITLLICLLRNMKPTIPQPPFGFDNLPHSSHTTDGAHVARIKYYRNRLAHSTDGKLSNTDFTNYCSDLEVAIKCLGGSTFGKEVNDAKARNLDNTLAEILRQLTKYDKQYIESSDAIKELRSELDVMDQGNKQRLADVTKRITELEDKLKDKSDGMSNLSLQLEQQSTRINKNSSEIRELQKAIAAMEMENIPNNRKELIRMHLEKWKAYDAMFIQTRAADKVYTMMKDNSCLTVTGNSGMGKTMTVRHVALKMLEEGYTVIPISHPEEIVMLLSAQKKTLFVVDDLCGRYTLNQGYLDRLKLKMEDIKLLLEKQYCKIIATCRLQVYRDVKFKTLSIFNVFQCNFNSKDIHLTPEETAIFAAQYFGGHADEGVTLSTQYDCFPFLCSVYHETKDVDFYTFFKNPFQFFGEEIDNLLLEEGDGKYKYCILVLCVIYNNNLTEGCLTGKHDRTTREIIEEVFEECELNRGTSPKCLHRTLQTLVGTFVTKEENFYKMIHDKLFDFVAFYLGKTMTTFLIEHADSGFLKERFLWDISDDKEDKIDFTISIPDDVVDTYIFRMIRDWTNKKVVDFFSNRNLKSLVFTDKVLYHLKKMNKSRRLELVSTLNNCKFQDTPLIQSCRTGNIKLTQWILEHDVNVNQYRTDGISPLHMACQEGNKHVVRDLLLHGADVNKCKSDGGSSLNTACDLGYTDVVTELLTKDNVDIDLCDNEGRTSFYLACQAGHVQIVKHLLQHEADINKCRRNGWSPLHIACYNKQRDVVTVLLKSEKVRIDLRDHEECSSMFVACVKGYAEIVKDLIRHGADINECLHNDWSLLHTACFHGHKDVTTELLMNNDLSVNLEDTTGRSSLYLACQEGHVQIVRDLLQHGVDVNKCGHNGWSPLHAACYYGHEDVITELLKNDKVKIDLCDDDGRSALYMACQNGYAEIVRFLLQHKTNPYKCDNKDRSPLHTACYNEHYEVVTELLKNDKVVIDLCDSMGYSPLHLTCRTGNVQIIKELLQHGADVNKCKSDGGSSLNTACEFGHTDVVTELLTKDNVDIDLCDNEGRTSLYLACQVGHVQIVKYLLQHEADINKCRRNGWSPLHIACYNKQRDVVTVLLKSQNVRIDLRDHEECSSMFVACVKGYAEIVKDLIRQGADINECVQNDWSLLHTACFHGHTDVITELLRNDDLSVNLGDITGRSSLYLACQEGHVQIVKELLRHGVDVNKCGQNSWSSLHAACYYDHEYVVTELLRNDNVKIDVCNSNGCSALYLVCNKGHVQIVRKLLQHGADMNKCDKNGCSPLYKACYYGHGGVVTDLLKNDDVKIDLCDNEGWSPLYLACQRGYVQIVRELLQHGADINKSSKNDMSPLHAACYYGHIDVVTELLKNDNVTIDLCDNEGRSSLYLACQWKYVQLAIVRELLQHGADINKCSKNGCSPLYSACNYGLTDIVTELLKNDTVKINLYNKGYSPLYFACEQGNVQLVRVLVQFGADINIFDRNSWSPLHTTCYWGHTDVVTELLKSVDVSIDSCDDFGESSLYLACRRGYLQIVRELVQYGADINNCNSHGNSPLQIACINNHTNIVSELLKYDVMLDVQDNDGDTSLYSACEEGHNEIVKLLLERGVNVNKCSNTGESPLLVSCVLGNIDIVDMLLTKDVDVNLCIHSKDVYMEEIKIYQNIHSGLKKTFWAKIKEDGLWKTKEYNDGDDWIIDKTAGASSIHLACFMGHDEVVNLLLMKSQNINMTTDDGTTPLFLACEIGHEYLVTLLLTGGADAGMYRQDRKSPYRVALDNGHTSLASMLLRWTNGVDIIYQRS